MTSSTARRPIIHRLYPVADHDRSKAYDDDRAVCSDCVSGACCSSEGPIAVSAFDILRLASHLDLTPERFLKLFTQDRFDDCPFDPAQTIDDPADSTVTYLRRRGPEAFSPCIFLKYVTAAGNVPRRVCSVHDGRPLACREYYFDTCKTRWTGELAVGIAEAFGALGASRVSAAAARDGMAGVEREASGAASMRLRWQRAMWAEVIRAAHPDASNSEGTVYSTLPLMQRPTTAKLAHMLNTRRLRFEEKYGPEPRDEQLHSYQGASIAADERRRLLGIATRRAPRRLFKGQDYPYIAGTRFLLPHALGGPEPTLVPAEASDTAVIAAIGRGLSFVSAVAWQIVARGASANPHVDRDVALRLMSSLTLIDLDRLPKPARDPQLATIRRRLSRRLSKLLANETAWIRHNTAAKRDVARWWRPWATLEAARVPADLERQVARTRRVLDLPPRRTSRAGVAGGPISADVALEILASQDRSGGWGVDIDGTVSLSHYRYVDAALRQTARHVQRLSRFIEPPLSKR